MSDFLADDRALLAAVIARPRDDGPRLAFADCVRERGMGELADFVEWQMAHPKAIARRYGRVITCSHGPGSNQSGPAPFRVWFKAFSLEVCRPHPNWTWTWRRGFVAELRMSADDAVLYLPELLKIWPVTRVTVVGEPNADVLLILRARGILPYTGQTRRGPTWLRWLGRMVGSQVRFTREPEPMRLPIDADGLPAGTVNWESARDELGQYIHEIRRYLASVPLTPRYPSAILHGTA